MTDRQQRAEDKRSGFPVVGLGASAGGLESLERLFDELPRAPGAAFVIVQHLAPDFPSMMSELLARHTEMPVAAAQDGVQVERDHVYLLPPKKEMRIEDGRLRLAEKEPTGGLNLPIDVFFRSLADDRGRGAVAVVLSGSGSDGSRGVREIKRAGGRVLAETPASAAFEGMPSSALATGAVDYSGDISELARELCRSVNGEAEPAPAEPAAGDDADDDDDDDDGDPVQGILNLLRRELGLDFSHYKKETVSRRITRRADLQGVPDLRRYLNGLRGDAEELGRLYHDLLIGVTRFFRDPETFNALEHKAIPEILERVPETEEIRLWSAGCATGEEPYSLAMLLHEALGARRRPIEFKILATDVHRLSLERASAGVFTDEQLEHVSPERRARFFTLTAAGYQVSQDLRQRIVFAPHDVIRDAPFTNLQLVTCRNLLIYLEPEAQQTVIQLFHFGLVREGILLLGSSESPGALASEFDAVDEHHRLYRKRRDVRLLDPGRVPVARTGIGPRVPGTPGQPQDSAPQLLSVYDRLLDRYMPAAFLVDHQRSLVDSFGGAERYLSVPGRRPSNHLSDLLVGDLKTVATGAIQRAMSKGGIARHRGVPVDGGRVTVTAEGLSTGARAGQRHVLLTLEPEETEPPSPTEELDEELDEEGARDAAEARAAEEREAYAASADRIDMLEADLAYARETLNAAVEAQQASNEELQASNEELVASNEELQSTNEELHSVNEELNTVNGEYQKKIRELRELNNDMQHLLEATDVGALFLDSELRLRKFTPRATNVFHIRPADVGRDLRDFTHNLIYEELFDDLAGVLQRNEALQREVKDAHGTTYFLRVLPYRPVDEEDPRPSNAALVSGEPERGDVDGVMISLADISGLDEARGQVRELSAIVESSQDAIIGKDLDGHITSWNAGAERLYGFSAEEVVGRSAKLLIPDDHLQEEEEALARVRRGERVNLLETRRRTRDGELIDVSVTISPINDADGRVVGASSIARDIGPLKTALVELEEREARIRLLLASTAEAIYGVDSYGVCRFSNPRCATLLGYDSPEDLLGLRMHEVMHHSRPDGTPYPALECPLCDVLRTGEPAHVDGEQLFRKDGTSFPAEAWSHPIERDGRPEGAVVTFLDITERKRAHDELRLAAERREQFLAMLSHELRNPLAAVLSATRVIKAQDDENAVAAARAVIERQSEQMARLLDDLLDVSRVTRGGIELRAEPLDLRDAVQQAIESVDPELEQTGTSLDVSLPDTPMVVHGDSARLQQVVSNLLTNAARYSPRGSLVRLSVKRAGQSALLVVEDDGDGIEPELLPRIFELFMQTDQGLERSRGGLGVGLALVKQLVTLHGGQVRAHSDGPGEGSRFEVSLPCRRDDTIPLDDAPRTATLSQPIKVVLVEDQDDARMMLKALLETRGYLVLEARDGREAIETIPRVAPDAALIDIGLPELDGFEVARRLRDLPACQETTLIALTGYGTDEDVRAAREAGFCAHLTKPADPDDIEEILARRAGGDATAEAPADDGRSVHDSDAG